MGERSEVSETLLGVTNGNRRYMYLELSQSHASNPLVPYMNLFK